MKDIYGELEAIYRRIPDIHCAGLCQESCGPIGISRLEAHRIERRAGNIGKVNSNNLCPLLNRFTGKCSVYHIRPVLCRLWGVVESMPCKFGCIPDPRYLTHQEGLEILRQVKVASERIGYSGMMNTAQDQMLELMLQKMV